MYDLSTSDGLKSFLSSRLNKYGTNKIIVSKTLKKFIKDNVVIKNHDFFVYRSNELYEEELSPQFPRESIQHYSLTHLKDYVCSYYFSPSDSKKYYSFNELKEKHPDCFLIKDRETFCHAYLNEKLNVIFIFSTNVVRCGNKYVEEIADNYCYFIFADGTIFSLRYDNIYKGLGYYYYSSQNNRLFQIELIKACKKLFGISMLNVGGNKILPLNSLENVSKIAANINKCKYKATKSQSIVDNFVNSYPLPDRKIKIKNFDPTVLSTQLSIDKVKENSCVIRWQTIEPVTKEVEDTFRIYIEGKDCTACKINNEGKFVYSKFTTLSLSNFSSSQVTEFNKSSCTGTCLEYYSSVINKIPDKYRGIMLIAFIKYPIVERLFKAGLSSFFYECIKNGSYDFVEELKLRLSFNEKEKNIFKQLGVNKHQFELLANSTDCFSTMARLCGIKNALECDLATVDDNTTDSLISLFSKVRNYRAAISTIKTVKSWNNADIFKNFVNSAKKISYGYYVDDYISMLNDLELYHDFSLIFDNNTLKIYHDNLSAIYRVNKNKINSEKFKKAVSEIKDLEYIDDKEEEYCVIIPKDCLDLVTEGNNLHHCVGSYVNKVIARTTNIVFIRKKDDVNTSFFTVEVDNDNIIQQVHGMCNCCASSVDGLDDFVKRWARKKHLKLNSINKIR